MNIEEGQQNKMAFHLAGIIPVAGQPLDFNMPWHDCMMPVAPDYLAIENAVYECAYAGCETIWIVCHKEMQPLIRHKVGEYVLDPVWIPAKRSKFVKHASQEEKQIPIYYVPIHPKDRDKRDCLAWSVLYGAVKAFHVSALISKWVIPDMYYVSFPYGIYNPKALQYHRRDISSSTRFFLSYDGKTVADGEYLGFTFNVEDFVNFRRIIRKEGTGMWASGGYWDEENNTFNGEKLNPEERYSARFFDLTTVFGDAKIGDGKQLELYWYYNIGNWDGYCEYLSSEERKTVKRPSYELKYREFAKIGEGEGEEEG